MDIFGPKRWVNPFRKMSIFRVFELFSYILKRHFFVLECHRRHFRGLYCLKKKEVRKMAIFGPKPCLNPLGKTSIFRLCELLVFYSVERGFFFLEYHKRRFPGLYWLKKKSWKNCHFWTKTMD